MKKKILIISVGRSDYDRYLPILSALHKSKKTKLSLFLASAHYNKKLGHTANYVDKKFNIIKGNFFFKDHDMIYNFSQDLKFLSSRIKKLKPDLLIVLGDRYEMLLGPIIAAPKNIPVIHFYGGAVTEGAIDELVRHAITKMSHFHFVVLEQYRKRLIQLGEEKWRVKNIGLHQIEKLKSSQKTIFDLNKKYNFNFSKPYALMTFHPITLELSKLKIQFMSLIKAIKLSQINVVITYPNADPKYNTIISLINKNFKNKKKYKIIKNLGTDYYSTVMQNSQFIIGNSSSGIVESASFKIPCINIGTRQDGKHKPQNIINVSCNYKAIVKAINNVRKPSFMKKIKNIKNPYESKISTKKLVDLILKIKNTDKVLRKKFIKNTN
jgi:GDP/UDP-N,N'-diacetylbacillosamine 2-epimerase (hydrolysing)